MVKDNTVKRLQTLNELFACTGASIPDRAEHVRQVLHFLSSKQDLGTAELSFAESVDRLVKLHFGPEEERRLFFVHWDIANDESFNPLWLRHALISQIKQIAGSGSAFLLVTGLREAICPKGFYWTKKCQARYEQTCDYINELTCSWLPPSANLQLVLL